MPIKTTPRPVRRAAGTANPAPPPVRSEVAWIAHAGSAIALRGGAPTPASLWESVEVGADWIELDVCSTSDDALVLRHDITLASGQPLATLSLPELRRREPGLLTLDEGIELIGGRAPLLLDIKTELAVPALARRLMRASGAGFAVCTESTSALTEMRARAPRIGRWLSLPDMGAGSYQGVRSVVSGLLKHRYRGGLSELGRELGGALKDVKSNPADGLARFGGLWRLDIPQGDEPIGLSPSFRLIAELTLPVGIGARRASPTRRLQLLQ